MEVVKIDWDSGKEGKTEDNIGFSLHEESIELEELNVFGEADYQKNKSKKMVSAKKEFEEEDVGFDGSELRDDEFESDDEEVSKPSLTSPKVNGGAIEFYQDSKSKEVDENVREHSSRGSTRIEEKFEEGGTFRNSKEVGRVDARSVSESTTTTKESKTVTIVVKEPSTSATAVDAAKFLALSARFERGREVVTTGEKGSLMSFLQVGNELMAFRVFDPNPVVRIPAYVADLPVKYIHPEFLKGGLTPFSGIKFETVKSLFNSDKIASLNRNSLKESLKGAKAVELPSTLVSLPPKVFEKCLNLKSIVVPASVTAVSNRAFSYSCFSDIWFEGECPMNFLNNSYMPRNVKIHVKKEFLGSFVGEVRG